MKWKYKFNSSDVPSNQFLRGKDSNSLKTYGDF